MASGRCDGSAGAGARSLSASRRILILAPHPDDELVACGIAARRARFAGAKIFVLYLTTGVPPRDLLWRWQRGAYQARVAHRHDEALAVADLMGFEPAEFLDIPSRRLVAHLDDAMTALERALRATAAGELWVPAFEGAHQDHDAANALAARLRARLAVWEFAAYNYAGGKTRTNHFADARGGVIELRLNRDEAMLKRRALAIYASERSNLAHIRVAEEAYRPLPRHDYASPPHSGTLFRERFHWVPFRHPRIDFTPSAEVYAATGRWYSSQTLDIAPAADG